MSEAPLLVGTTFTEISERVLVGPLFRPFAEQLVARVAPNRGDSLIDIACRTGHSLLGRRRRVESHSKGTDQARGAYVLFPPARRAQVLPVPVDEVLKHPNTRGDPTRRDILARHRSRDLGGRAGERPRPWSLFSGCRDSAASFGRAPWRLP